LDESYGTRLQNKLCIRAAGFQGKDAAVVGAGAAAIPVKKK